MSCGAALSSPGSFFQVIGFVLIAISSIPLGLGVVLEGEHNHLALIIGGVVFVLGLILVVFSAAVGKRVEEPPTIRDQPPGLSQG